MVCVTYYVIVLKDKPNIFCGFAHTQPDPLFELTCLIHDNRATTMLFNQLYKAQEVANALTEHFDRPYIVKEIAISTI